MKVRLHGAIDDIPGEQWNAMVPDNNPFMRHEFLAALETHGCVGREFGWIPCHIAVYLPDAETGDGERLCAAMPLYQKFNSYGEFVFDHAWADAYKRSGLQYFPKLVSSAPYTPATGTRLLSLPDAELSALQNLSSQPITGNLKPDSAVRTDAEQDKGTSGANELTLHTTEDARSLLIQAMTQFAHDQDISSFHCLFPLKDELDWLAKQAPLGGQIVVRHDCQYHWHNRGYTDFEMFLSALNAKKRKNIRQERRRVEQSGIVLRTLDGHNATSGDWQQFAHFYTTTFEEKWSTPTLNAGFFQEIAEKLPDQVLLVMADTPDGQCIAGSLMYRSDTHLYGRHWGCIAQVDKLHFEACYYQGIEYCIREGIQTFEPGAQGQHKIARGFIPTLTRSAHWLNQSPYQDAIRDYTLREQEAIADYMQELKSPYQDE